MYAIEYREQDGVEFIVELATNLAGISQSGLAILCGVSRRALNKLENTLGTKSPSESLESFVGIDLTLGTNISESHPKLRNARVYKSDYCAAVIEHYAFKGNKTAQFSLRKFASIGIDTWIRGIVGVDFSVQPRSDRRPDALDPSSPCEGLFVRLPSQSSLRL